MLFADPQQSQPDSEDEMLSSQGKFFEALSLLEGKKFDNIELSESVWKEIYQKAGDTKRTIATLKRAGLRVEYERETTT